MHALTFRRRRCRSAQPEVVEEDKDTQHGLHVHILDLTPRLQNTPAQ
jgi:hypothetical protein